MHHAEQSQLELRKNKRGRASAQEGGSIYNFEQWYTHVKENEVACDDEGTAKRQKC